MNFKFLDNLNLKSYQIIPYLQYFLSAFDIFHSIYYFFQNSLFVEAQNSSSNNILEVRYYKFSLNKLAFSYYKLIYFFNVNGKHFRFFETGFGNNTIFYSPLIGQSKYYAIDHNLK